MYECEFKEIIKTDPRVQNIVSRSFNSKSSFIKPTGSKNTITILDIKNAVMRKKDPLFGFLKVHLKVPNVLRQTVFSEFPPLICKKEVGFNDQSPLMKSILKETGYLKKPREMLISCWEKKDMIVSSELLAWYLEHGVELVDVEEILHYTPVQCFKYFTEQITTERLKGDFDPNKKALTHLIKMLGSSAYGKFIMNVENQRDYVYCHKKDAMQYIKSKYFSNYQELGNESVEITLKKKNIAHDMPLQIAVMVYMDAKRQLLSFAFDVIDKYIQRDLYTLLGTDTDSLFISFAGNNIFDVLKPELKLEFLSNYDKYFVHDFCSFHKSEFISFYETYKKGEMWIPPTPCYQCYLSGMRSKREPGLFKLEFENGDYWLALNSKMYIVGNNDETKISSKGLSKKTNKITKDHFEYVLETQRSLSGENMNFVPDGCYINTQIQTRAALSFTYLKRWIMDDGITTKPLQM